MNDSAIAAAQACRDRTRLAAVRNELLKLRRRVMELEHSPSRRALEPLRRVVHAFRTVPQTAAPGDRGRGRALIIDHDWPQPDRDSGSIDIVNMVQALRGLGFDAVLAASNMHAGRQPARDKLVEQGVRCLDVAEASSVEDYLIHHGAELDLCVLCRVFCGGSFLELVERHCPAARIVFNSIDLNFVRESRRAETLGDEALMALGADLRAREEHVVRHADATIVVSDYEAELLAATMPDCLTVKLPLARPVTPPRNDFTSRAGIGFIGGFAHAPNVDAVRHFLVRTWPLLHDLDVELTIVGAGAPPGLLDGVDGRVRILGHLPDIGPWLEGLRATIAPLRFGAGAKGKVATSLCAGVPCVATSVAAEGMALGGADGVLVVDDPGAFAAAIVRITTDEAQWNAVSAGGLAFAARNLSLQAWQERLDGVLRRLGL